MPCVERTFFISVNICAFCTNGAPQLGVTCFNRPARFQRAAEVAMSGLRCLTLSRSSDPGPPTLEELLRGNSERGKLYHAVLKKLRDNTAFSSWNHQRRASTEGQDWRPEPYSRAIVKTPQHTPLSTPGPSSRYNHPYSRAGSSAAVRPDVGPYASVSSSPVRPTRAAPAVLQNKTGARQRGVDYTSAACAPTPLPPLDGPTPTETPAGGSGSPCLLPKGC